jgi:hypothetical protein
LARDRLGWPRQVKQEKVETGEVPEDCIWQCVAYVWLH